MRIRSLCQEIQLWETLKPFLFYLLMARNAAFLAFSFQLVFHKAYIFGKAKLCSWEEKGQKKTILMVSKQRGAHLQLQSDKKVV